MTREEIISRLGWLNLRHIDDSPDSILSRIEKLVADAEAAERTACAISCEVNAARWVDDGRKNYAAHECAADIRARSMP